MVHELKTWPLLDVYRGRPRADIDALVSAVVAFSEMAAQLGSRLVEAEINPLFVLPGGEGIRGQTASPCSAHDERFIANGCENERRRCWHHEHRHCFLQLGICITPD
jgi:hypothetical protein